MELAIQKFIRENGLQAAIDKWSLKVQEVDNLVLLNYDQINTPAGIQETNECRGLILDKSNNYNVVSCSFYRFFNDGEGHAAKVNLETSVLFEKLDGSLLDSYSYLGKRYVSTRGRIFADGEVSGNLFTKNQNEPPKTFAKLFWDTVKTNYPNADFDGIPTNINLVFELFGPENRILTPYAKNDVLLLSGRYVDGLGELTDVELDSWSRDLGIPRPKRYEFKTKEDIIKIFETFKPTDEGFVLTDYGTKVNGNYARIKIKNPRYLALHHLLGAGDENCMSNKKIIPLIKTGEIEEVIAYFPEYEPQIKQLRENLLKLSEDIQSKFESIKHLGVNRRDFAMEATKTPYAASLFNLLDNKSKNAWECVMGMKEEILLQLIKV